MIYAFDLGGKLFLGEGWELWLGQDTKPSFLATKV